MASSSVQPAFQSVWRYLLPTKMFLTFCSHEREIEQDEEKLQKPYKLQCPSRARLGDQWHKMANACK